MTPSSSHARTGAGAGVCGRAGTDARAREYADGAHLQIHTNVPPHGADVRRRKESPAYCAGILRQEAAGTGQSE